MARKPGFANDVQLTNFGVREAEITHNMATVWYVCYASQYKTKKSSYSYIFLDATDEFQEGFSFRQNILCIFHPFETIDARLMDAIDRILETNSNRLDRLCVFLVTNARAFSAEIQVDPEKDIRIHVPFSYQELGGGAAGKKDLIAQKLREYLYPVDLFAISSVLKTDRNFFGRKENVQSLVGQYERGENSSLFGLRRIGKTSLLWAVVRELKVRDAPVALIDCSDTKYHKTSWNKALFRVKEALYLSLGIKNQGYKQDDYSEADASSCFVEDLRRIKNSYSKPTLLIFDEIENLCFSVSEAPSWKDGTDSLPFWQSIRSAYQQNTNLFSFLMCGTNPLILERTRTPSGSDNPLYRYISPRYLEFFDIDDVEKMLVQLGSYIGVAFDRQIFTYLTDEYGGHPFLVRQVASHLRAVALKQPKTGKISVRKEDYFSNRAEISQRMQGYIGLILEVLMERYQEEYELLRLLAAGQAEEFQRNAAEYPEAIAHITGYGLVKRVGSNFHFRIGVVEEVVRHAARELRCPDSMEERWGLIGQERNLFEWKCRKMVRSILKVIYGEDEAKGLILSVMKAASQVEKCSKLKFDEIFSEKGELYLLDLKDIITKEWAVFKKAFQENKQKFQVSMDAANKYRIDTHAKDITRENFKKVMPQLVWLHDCVEKSS